MNSDLQVLNRLVWQPCTSMHPLWWERLDLQGWKEKYKPDTVLARRIDALVATRYGLAAQERPVSFSKDDLALLKLKGKLSAVVTVLGLFYLNRPDYLSLRAYREALTDVLTEHQILQAWALWPQRPAYPLQPYWSMDDCAPQELVLTAMIVALSVLQQQYRASYIWSALALTLPPVTEGCIYSTTTENSEITAGRWLFRLGSFI